MAVYTAQKRPDLSGARTFTWVNPQGKRATEYEDLTVGQQSTPAQYAFQGWPIRFDDGRDPYSDTTTAVKSSDWYAYRDPSQMTNRHYVVGIHEAESALEQSFKGAHAAGLFEFADPEWIKVGIGQHYMTYPHVEYGEFLALCYAEREALSDTVTFALVFEAADKARHLQDVVYYSFEMAEAHPGFDDTGVESAWKNDPIWQGARKAIENIIASNDWMEIVVAINLCVDRLFGELAKVEYFSRFAAANGDIVTPIIIASSEGDSDRTVRATSALIKHLVNDPTYGEKNKEQINAWVAKWNEYALEACDAFSPVFDMAPTKPTTYKSAMAHVEAKQAEYLKSLGLTVPAARG